MPRKLKTYLTSIGFFDLAVAAPSMKAALEAWGARRNLFHHGNAQETDDSDIVAATMAQPGIVLRRAVGTNNAFKVDAELPKSLPADAKPLLPKAKTKSVKRRPSAPPISERAQKAAIIQFDKEKARREQSRAKEEAARRKQEDADARDDERRQKAVEKAQAALNRAKDRHRARMKTLERERQVAEANLDAERKRWNEESEELESNMRKADR